MHIESVRVEDFGTINSIELDLDEGLNVISGPNETGKSTLMRAIWFALTRRSRSQASEIRSIEPHGGGTPEVEVCLNDNGTRYRMEKVFNGQSGTTSLEVEPPDEAPKQHSGEEADEVIREAVGFSASSGRSGVPDHFGFWPAVWVGQDDRRTDPGAHLSEEGDPESISSILAEMGGDVMAGAGTEIVERAKEEYERFFTKGGNYTSRSGAPLQEAKEECDRLQERFEELEKRRKTYEDDLDELGRLQREIEGIDEQLPELEKEAEEAREAFDRAETLRGELETAESTLDAAESKAGRIEDRLDRLTELTGRVETLEDDLEEKREEIGTLDDRLDAHRDERSPLKEAVHNAEEKEERLDRRLKELRAHLDVLRARERLDAIDEQAEELDTLKERRDDLAGEIAGIDIDEDTVEELEDLKEEHNETRTRLETAAAQLRFRAREDIDLQVGEEGLSLSEGEEAERRIDEPTTVEVADLLEVDIEPGGKDLNVIREEARKAKDACETALEEAGVGSVAEARSERQRRTQLERELSSVKEQIEDLLPEEGSDLEEARAHLESRLESAKEKRGSYAAPNPDTDSEEDGSGEDRPPDDASLEEPPDEEEDAQEIIETVEEDLEAATEALGEAREALDEHDTRAQELKEDLQQKETQAEGVEESLAAARQDLQDHKEEHGSEEGLQSALDEAKQGVEKKKSRVEELEDELASLSPEDVEARKDRAEDALDNTKGERQELKSKLDKVQGRLESDDLHGLHERLGRAKQDLENAQAEVDRLERQAEAAKLLYETLTEKRAEARRQYLAPLRDEAEDLLGRFFGSERATVEFGDSFGVERFSRPENGTFPFDQLSAGAKQQLSVLTRLSMAKLIAEQRPHPVFLDDALSDTDPERFDAMADILRSVARKMQIIMTTCHHDRHRRLGVSAHRMADLKQ